MKFLIHSSGGAGKHIAQKLKEEGQEVLLYLLEGEPPEGIELVPMLGDGVKQLDRFKDIVIFDASGQGKVADTLRTAGYNVLFSSKFSDRLEEDKDHAMTVAESAGIKINNTETQRLDPATVINLTIEMWFQEGKPLFPCNSTLEVDSLGLKTCVFWNYPEREPRLYGQVFKKLLILFKAAEYTGPCSVKCLIDKDSNSVSFLGFQMKPLSSSFCSLLEVPLSQFLTELVFSDIDELPVKDKEFSYSLCVNMCQDFSTIGNSIHRAGEKTLGTLQETLEKGIRQASKDYNWMNVNRYIASGGEVRIGPDEP